MFYVWENNIMRKSREDWLKTGFRTLGRDGTNALTIDRMAEELELTKGSFYHHFANMADYKDQLIAYWAEQYLSTAGQVPEDPVAALALLDTVMSEAFGSATEPEVAIRAWAQQDDNVRKYVEKVDELRRAFVFQIFFSLTGDMIQARHMADILFTMLIGCIMALPRYSSERVSILYAEFKRIYGLQKSTEGRSAGL
jgi:AcrR family transcriptional regulator